MKKIVFACFLTVAIAFAGMAQTAKSYYGDKITDEGAKPATEIPALLKEKKEVKDMKVTGTVKSVCQVKGCWMTLEVADGQQMTIKFKDYGFFMPKDCSGKKVTFYGNASKKVISVAEQKHLAEDAGKSKEEIEKITQPKEEFRFEASGVVLEG